MSNNINDRILARAFNKNVDEFIDVESKMLPELYKKIYDYVNKYYISRGSVPSVVFMLNKVIKGQNDESILRNILKKLPEDDNTVSNNELKEELEEEYSLTGLYDSMDKIQDAIEKRDMSTVKREINSMEAYLLTGKDDLLESDGEDFFSDISVDLTSTGFNFGVDGLDNIALGSIIGILANSGVGKSVCAIKVFNNKIEDGYNPVMYSYEVNTTVLRARMLSNLTGVPFVEIIKNRYLADNKSRVDKARYFYTKKMVRDDIDRLTLDQIKELPSRENKFKIRAVLDIEDFKKGKILRDMPTYEELMPELELFNKEGYDTYIIDLITSITSRDPRISDYEAITNTIHDLKKFALRNGSTFILPAQAPEDNVVSIRYSRALLEQMDLVVALIPTPKLSEYTSIGLGVVKSRHSKDKYVLVLNDRKECIDFTTDGLEVSYDDTLSEWKKARNKNGNSK